MNTAMMQELVAEKIQLLYQISRDLETLFPGRHYTLDGHMIGSIGEALAASFMAWICSPLRKRHMMPRHRMADWCRSKQLKFRELLCPVNRSGCLF